MATVSDVQRQPNESPSSMNSNLVAWQPRASYEMVISPAVEQAVTEIKLAAQLAMMMPRDVAYATDVLLELCEDPVFADEAIWEKKQGKKKDENSGQWVDNYIDGFSIRFVEEAIVTLRHFRSTVTIVLETQGDGRTPGQRTVAVSVWDCQSNASHSDQIHILKIVERTSAQYRESDIAYERINSEKKVVFGLHATHAEVKTMQAAEVSKMIRTLALRLIPSKLKRICYQRCLVTILKEVQQDLPKSRKATLTAFAGIKVSREMLEDYLGISFDSTTAEQITTLQNVGKAIKAGETTWKEFSEPVTIDDDGSVITTEVRPEKPEPRRSRTTRPADVEHGGKAGAVPPTPAKPAAPIPPTTGEQQSLIADPRAAKKPADDADPTLIYNEIDECLDALVPDGDGGVKLQYETEARKAVGAPPTGDLPLAVLKALRDELKKAVKEAAEARGE